MAFFNNILGGSQEERLIKAIEDNNFESVKELLSKKPNLNFITENGANPLMKSMFSKNRDIFQLIINSGPNVNFSTKNGYSPLIIACKQNDLDRIRVLLSKGANINQKTKQGWTALLTASENPIYSSENFDNIDLEKIRSNLQTSSSNKNSLDEIQNMGILEEATFKSIIKSRQYQLKNDPSVVVKLLLSSGANPNECSHELDGYSPLLAASTYANYQTIRVLLENGSQINHKDTYQETALGYVLEGTVDNYFKKIYNTDFVPVNIKDEMFTSPFTLKWIDAIRPNYEQYCEQSVDILLKNGADIHTCDEKGNDIFIKSIRRGNLNIIKNLVDVGADINHKNSIGLSSIHSAAIRGNNDIINFLLTKGADINAEFDGGETPLMTAIWNGRLDTVKLLIDKGANVKCKKTTGEKPLLWVTHKYNENNSHDPKYEKMYELLLAAGAEK